MSDPTAPPQPDPADVDTSAEEVLARRPAILPREGLDFGLDAGIARHWFGGHPFKTRFFDAMSTIFPEGERFFIACVRDFRTEIQDPALMQAVQDFCRQEAQHCKVHSDFNQLLRQQGIKVDKLSAYLRHFMFNVLRVRLSAQRTLALTAASEHLTAIMAFCLFERVDQFADADPRVRALFGWHAIEEVEHKAVAFDVMQQVAGVGYWARVSAMLQVSVAFPLEVFRITNYMLRVDGYTRWQRTMLWLRGLRWLYGPRTGIMIPLIRPYLAWFRPSFHPWDIGQQPSYPVWADALAITGDPVAATDAVHSVAKLNKLRESVATRA